MEEVKNKNKIKTSRNTIKKRHLTNITPTCSINTNNLLKLICNYN